MIRLTKGAKQIFGWVVVGEDYRIILPPEAVMIYSFSPGCEVIFLPGSQKSGGFGISILSLVSQLPLAMQQREICRSNLEADYHLKIPESLVQPQGRLLAVLGSSLALSLITKGFIYQTALKYPEIEVY